MPTLVVPFRGADSKSRLELPTPAARAELARAMLADVVAVGLSVGPTFVVAPEPVGVAGVADVSDLGRGQGVAVRAGLDSAVAAGAAPPFVVVNADLPCVSAADLLALIGAVPPGGLALARAVDGTTNALALASAELFEALYGPGSAARFSARGGARVVDRPNLRDDVDTIADLERLGGRLGPSTQRVLTALRTGAAA